MLFMEKYFRLGLKYFTRLKKLNLFYINYTTQQKFFYVEVGMLSG